MMETYNISTQVYYHDTKGCHSRIFVIDRYPNGPLSLITRTLRTPRLSPFKQNTSCCAPQSCTVAFCHQTTKSLLEIHEQPILLNYLLSNGYVIETELTKLLMNNHINMETNRNLLFVISRTTE